MKSVAVYMAKFGMTFLVMASMTIVMPFVFAIMAWFLGLFFPNTFAAIFALIGWNYSPFLAGLAIGVIRTVMVSVEFARVPFQVAAEKD